MFRLNVFRTAVLMLLVAAFASPAARLHAITPPPPAPIVVTGSSLQGWLLFNDGTTPPATAAFVNGPGTPPLGTGSYGTAITVASSKIVFGRTDAAYNGILLSTLTNFSYSTYVDPTSTNPGKLNWYASVYLDTTGTGTTYNYRLDFDPPGSTLGTWQTWNAMTQPYWTLYNHSTFMFGPVGTLATVTAGLPANTRIIQGFTTSPNYPSIKFTMGDMANDYVGFVGNIDNITIGFNANPFGGTTWDLEMSPALTNTPTATATSTATNTNTVTNTPTNTATATSTATGTPSNTPSSTTTGTTTALSTTTATATGTLATATSSPTGSITATVTATGSIAVTFTPTQPPVVASATPNVQIADPVLAKIADVSLAQPGSPVKFTLTVTNIGTAAASGVVVVDSLPSPLQFVSATASQGAFAVSGNTVTFTVGTVNPGQVITLTISTMVSASAQPPLTVINTATLNDGQGHSSSSSASIRITGGSLPGTGEHPTTSDNPPWRLLVGGFIAFVIIGLGFRWRQRTA